jgi:membrane-bound lytic murein transglycosylase D
MFLFVIKQLHAKTPQPHVELLLHSGVHDSLITKTVLTKQVTVASVQLQKTVQPFVETYLEEHADLLEKIKQQNSSSFKTIEKILVKRGIPAELLYLAVVESKLKNKATSGAGAVGIWQLMPVTARSLGLNVTAKTDERRYIIQSSVAAANYLNILYKQFDDWLLVVAAYNCGAGNVYNAIKQSGSREFWKLQRFLPAETRNHVKRFIATHYYYEGEGSVVTLTKKERIIYLASLEHFTIEE